MNRLPDSVLKLLETQRRWVVLVVGTDPRESALALSHLVAETLGIARRPLSSALSVYDLDHVLGIGAATRRVFVLSDVAAYDESILAATMRRLSDSSDILVVGTDDYSLLRMFANMIELVADDRIALPSSVSDSLLTETSGLLRSSRVDTTAELARRAGLSSAEIMKYVLLPQSLLRDIRPHTREQDDASRSDDAVLSDGARSASDERVFDELPLRFVNALSPKPRGTYSISGRGSAAPVRRTTAGAEVDRSRVRAHRPGRFSLYHTILAAAPYQQFRRLSDNRDLAVVLDTDDIRRYPFIARARKLTVVVIDSSGSMASSARIRYAKGLVADLLKHSYRGRSYVALIVARGEHAAIVCEPTRSVSRVHTAMRAMPTGGATPLLSSIAQAMQVVVDARRRFGDCEAEVIFVTDGKSNVGSAADGDIRRHAIELHRRNIALSVADVVRKSPSAVRFAEALGARYTFYPRGEAATHLA